MSAQPTLSTARDQAIKYGYPSWSVLTSTPNGTAGIGEFFYSYWQNAVDSDELFEIDEKATEENQTNNNYIYEKFKKDSDEIINAPGKNGFARVYFHWSEDPRKDDSWYEEQCREQNYNKRKIAQEKLVFLNKSNLPFRPTAKNEFFFQKSRQE